MPATRRAFLYPIVEAQLKRMLLKSAYPYQNPASWNPAFYFYFLIFTFYFLLFTFYFLL